MKDSLHRLSRHVALMAVLCSTVLALALVFSACGGGPGDTDGDGTGGGSDPDAIYTIACESGDYYDLSADRFSATAGTTVTVTVSSEAFIGVDKVLANGTECSGSGGTYTFVMPSENVTVTAQTSGVEVLNADDGMGWVRATDTLSVAAENDTAKQTFEVTFGTDPVFNNKVGNYMSQAEVVSTDESVIPADALTGMKSEDVTYAYTAEFTVDRTKVSEGETTLAVIDKDSHRVISINVEVVAYGEAFAADTIDVSISVDASALGDDEKYSDLRVYLVEDDETYVYGCAYPYATQWQTVTDTPATFKYIKGHGKHYEAYVGYGMTNDHDIYVYERLETESGTEPDGTVSFTDEDDSITIVVARP